MFEVFDHTADLGLRVRSPDLNGLFAEAGRALVAVLVSTPDSVEARETVRLEIAGSELEYLFFDWLHELLFLFESKRFLPREFEPVVNEAGLTANLRGETYDPDRHPLAHEVKAVTYHELAVEQTPHGWQAEVILDI